MRFYDSRGIEITTQSQRSAERYDGALDLLASYFVVPLGTHVHEMTGQVDTGVDFLRSRVDDWAPGNGLANHNFWHLALFLVERGEERQVLELFDRHIWPTPSTIALEMVDAASLLWRLYLHKIDVGTRATSVAAAWSDASYHGYYAFNDAHAAMALVADGNITEARRVVAGLERRAGGDGSNAALSRDVGLPLARAFVAFGEGRYDEVVKTLFPLRLIAHQFGGSNAQRDVIEQTLAEAAVRAGRDSFVRALAAERRLLRPESPYASLLERRLQRNSPRAAAE